jgi:transmembrane sensor
MKEDYLRILIQKYVDNTATEKEKELLMSWYRAQSSDDYILPYHDEKEELEAKDQLLKRLQKQIQPPQQHSIHIKPLWYKVAGIAALFIMVVWFVLKQHTLTSTPATPLQTLVSTRLGEHRTIHLSDGSIIWLSSGSRINYPNYFGAVNREVSFEGEAFFDIAKDKKHPFIIHTGGTSVKVLGTTFNIHAFKELQDITVSLITGKVAFQYKSGQVRLSPRQQLIYNKSKQTLRKQPITDVQAITGRRNGLYEYKNITVEDIAEDLHKNFNLNIRVDGGVKKCLFYGRKTPQESPIRFLQKMAFVVNASLVKTNNTYVIRGGGCALK